MQENLFPSRTSRDPNEKFRLRQEESRVICGKTIAAWDHAVVYVHDKHLPYEPPTHLYFSFVGYGPCLTTEVVALVSQWTYFRGVCHRTFREDEHEFRRAKQMAIQVVETYRRTYLEKHGQAPNPFLLQGTLNPDLARKRTNIVRMRLKDRLGHRDIEFPDLL